MSPQQKLTTEEWNEMNTLRKAITALPSSVSPEKMERFSQLFVQSLSGADDTHPKDRK
jgi:hypothetical protein